jgi:hypothetical protein
MVLRLEHRVEACPRPEILLHGLLTASNGREKERQERIATDIDHERESYYENKTRRRYRYCNGNTRNLF